MIDKLTYIVSTCKGYEAALQRLLNSIPGHAHAIVVSGGHMTRRVRYVADRTEHIDVTHTSYDYTALIELVEHMHDWSHGHVFLLHDTMELSPDSDRLIRDADPALDCVAAWGGECNLALYRVDYLHRMRARTLALKNCSKLRAVEMEGFLWRHLPPERRGAYPGDIAIGDEQPIYGGAARVPVTYTGVGITKYKANWGQLWPPSVVTP
jgi:hypothetical protein